MAISTIREFTVEDRCKVQAAAERFCERHNLAFESGQALVEIAWATASERDDNGRAAYLRGLWTSVYCRALNVPRDRRIITAYGYVGIACP